MAVEFSSDADYNKMDAPNTPPLSPSPIIDRPPPDYYPPTRYRKRDTESPEDDRETSRVERRTRARETRRTRRTLRLQEKKEVHARIDVSSSSDASSIDENYDIASLSGHDIEEHLT